MGLPNETGFVLDEEPMPAPLPDRVDDLIREAMQNRPELKNLRLQQSAAERFTKAEHALYYPAVGVIGTAGFVPTGYETVPGRYGAIGMNVIIPIFNGGLFKARQTRGRTEGQGRNRERERPAKPGDSRCACRLAERHHRVRPHGAHASSCWSRRNSRSTWRRPATMPGWAISWN